MVGAKQFSKSYHLMGNKGNPIIQRLTTPGLMEKQQPIKGSTFPFYDRTKTSSNTSKPKPKTTRVTEAELICLTDMSPIFSHLFPKKECEIIEIEEDNKVDVSDETINKITYKIFQNIHKYLKDMKEGPKDTKQIKISIDM